MISLLKNWIWALTGMMLLLPVSASAQQQVSAKRLTASDLEPWLDGVLSSSLKAQDIAGAIVVVVKDGQILLSKGYGYADVAKQTPVDSDRTLFRPGSISKLFTATAVMQLVEQGKIDLDADINTYLDFRVEGRGGKKITVRHLLTHRAGFEEGQKQIMGYKRPSGLTSTSYLKRWVPMRIYDPGTTPSYSNYGMSLAGYIVERVSGLSFETYTARKIFAPLGMTHSTFEQPLPPQLQPMMSKGYNLGSEMPQPFEIIMTVGAGALTSSGNDMARFMLAQLNKGQLGSARILQSATAKLMHNSVTDTIKPLNRIALGFFDSTVNGRRVIGHGGDTLYFHSNLSLFVEDNVGIYLSLNSSGKDLSAVHRAVFDGFADRYFPGGPLAPVVSSNAVKDAIAIAGEYRPSRRSASNFLAAMSTLSSINVTAGDDGSVTMFGEKYLHIGPLLWRTVDGKDRLAAVMSGGQVKWITTDATAPIQILEPVSAFQSSAMLIPFGLGALAIVVLTAISWPFSAAVRRYHGIPMTLQGRALGSYRLSRFFAAALIGVMILWAIVVSNMLNLDFPSDGLIIALQIGLFICVAGIALSEIWSIQAAPKPRSKRSILFASLLLAASAILLWVFGVLGFFNFTSNY